MGIEPTRLLLALIGVGSMVWGLVDLLTGTSSTLPGIYAPGMRFTREDDRVLFYLASTAKLVGGLLACGWVVMR